MKRLLNEIENLVNQGVIDEATAANISKYYREKEEIEPNKLLIIFGIIGACLIGLGLILIIAHNWDNLNKTLKTVLAYLPLVLTQGLFGYTLWQKRDSKAWQETSSILLFFSIGAAIALTSQIYQIEGNERSFLLIWCITAMPIVFLMPSSVISLFQLGIICRLGFASINWWSGIRQFIAVDQLLLFLGILVYYWHLIKKESKSLFTLWHHWAIPLVFSTLFVHNSMDFRIYGSLMFLTIYALTYSIGMTSLFKNKSLLHNPYRLIGALGTIIILFICSFYNYWETRHMNSANAELQQTSYFVALGILIIMTSYFLSQQRVGQWVKQWSIKGFSPIPISFIVFMFISIIGLSNGYIAMALVNLWLLAIGIHYINLGLNTNHLLIMNVGVLVIGALILGRFFEWNLSFVSRGVSFILLGCAFFVANYMLIKRSKI